jgi:hypothetical protein
MLIPLFLLAASDLDFSRPKPEVSEPAKDIERDRRQDSQILIEKIPIKNGRESTSQKKESQQQN